MKNLVIRTKFPETGAHDLPVSRLVYGTASFGGYDHTPDNNRMLDAYVSLGGSFVDTARVYGRWNDDTQTSYSEEILGKWLCEHRSSIRVSTKGCHPDSMTMSLPRISAECIRSDLGESLSALQTDMIDVYFLHRDNRDIPVSVIMDELNRQADAGYINLLGASNWTAARIYEANDYCVCHGMRGFDVSQICVNIFRPTPAMLGDTTLISLNDEEEALYLELDMPVMAFTSLAFGLVSRYFKDPDEAKRHRIMTPESVRRMGRIADVCKTLGISATEVSLGYLASQRLTVLPIVSTGKEEHLSDCANSCETLLPSDVLAYIDGK